MMSTAPSPLQQLIIERIQREGPITFAEYMRMALYDPQYGYYTTGPAKMGWEGDYYTSSDVSNLFAHCLGRQLYQMWKHLRHPALFTVLEQGAGRGQLAQEIRAWAQQEAPDLHAVLDYQNEDIRTGQDAIKHAASALTPSVILSNELVDALPVHIVEKREARLYEVYVAAQPPGRLYEELAEPSSPAIAGYLDDYKLPWTTFKDGWRAEINLEALRWMERTTHLLTGPAPARRRHGFLLTIDYGDKARALYTPYRHQGTLACYYRHQLTERPLIRPGEQDITAHVNFSALINEGRRCGLRLHLFTTQRQWLTDLGIYDELERLRARDFSIIDSKRATDRGQIALLQWYNLRQRVTALTEPGGMGNFKVLILKH
ncbi:MAG TPA: SAM-dependent methyltransferase [Ktedonosporobacter sp.]|nr:SAM-dependent methyltransferase [Ktedonosporobacter sp.]